MADPKLEQAGETAAGESDQFAVLLNKEFRPKTDRARAEVENAVQTLAQQARIMSAMVQRFFPAGTRMSRPQGGYVLWVEPVPHVDSMAVYQEALERGLTIGPGRMFSTSNTYGRFMRLNYSYPWSPEIEAAVIELGRIVAARSSRVAR